MTTNPASRRPIPDHDHDEHREGLEHDLPVFQSRGMVGRTWGRRGLLGLAGGLGAALVAGCGDDATSTTTSTGTSSSGSGSGMPAGGPGGGGGVSQAGLDDGDIPEETNGPYPADGSNGVNVLSESGIVRSDITASFGAASAVAAGVPLTIRLKVYDNNADGMTPYEGAAVYLWHCDAAGEYSLYSSGLEEENYLRGVQVADADGALEFTSIYPGCYRGRWPHIHFEVYGSVDDATAAGTKLRTSQIAFPADVCDEVYGAADGYASSQSPFAEISLDSDNVFSDGYSLQMASVTGSVDDGYVLTLNVPV